MSQHHTVGKIVILIALSGVALGGFCRNAAAQDIGLQVPNGYYVSSEDLALSLPSAISDTSGDYRILIERTYGNSEEERLLRIAEALYPPRDTLEAAIGRAHFKLKDVPNEKDLWWASSFDGIRLPYAITGRAVHYYLDLIHSFKRGDFEGSNGIRMQDASFRYTATIDRQVVFEGPGLRLEDVYVARLRLSWSNYCGPLCALGFQQDRVVVLSPEGEVLWVSGDRQSSALVS